MSTLFFTSAQHKERFLGTMQRIKQIHRGKCNPEYAAAVYILTAHLSIAQRSSGYIGCHRIDIATLLDDVAFSGGEAVLIELAGNLFNGERHLDPLELFRLDDDNFQVALASLIIRRIGYRVEQEA